MKKSMLALLLPVTAGVALAGTGFGVWVFANNAGSDMAGANLTLTAASQVKNVTIVNGDTAGNNKDGFTFDQYYNNDASDPSDPSDLSDDFTVTSPFVRDNGYVSRASTDEVTDTSSITYTDATPGSGVNNNSSITTYDGTAAIRYLITVDFTGDCNFEIADEDGHDNHFVYDISHFLSIDNVALVSTNNTTTLAVDSTNANQAKYYATINNAPITEKNVVDAFRVSLKWVVQPQSYEEYVALKTIIKSAKLTVTISDYTVIK